MMLAFLLLLAAKGPAMAVLTDDAYRLPAGEWRWVRFEIRQRPALATCRFSVVGDGEARAELVSRPELELFRQGKQHDVLALTDSLTSGALNRYIDEPGEYAVIIANPGHRPVRVHLTVTLGFGFPAPVSRYLSSQRRLTVILVSFGVFLAIVTLSGRALLRAMKR